jgi:hypothetical protein
MEWVLQVVDEIDDAVAMLRYRWLGAHAHVGMLAGGLAAAAAAASVVAASFKVRLSLHRARP